MNILHIDSSPFAATSISRMLGAKFIAALRQKYADVQVIHRDVGLNPPNHLSAAAMQAMRSGQNGDQPESVTAEIAEIDWAIQELMTCDMLVIGAPMYNHSIPSHLKAWIDQVCQARRTFKYGPHGPVGLVEDKPVFIISSRGNLYSTEALREHDFQEPFLVSILGLMGLKNVTVIRAEGIGLSEQHRAQAIKKAEQQITELVRAEKYLLAA